MLIRDVCYFFLLFMSAECVMHITFCTSSLTVVGVCILSRGSSSSTFSLCEIKNVAVCRHKWLNHFKKDGRNWFLSDATKIIPNTNVYFPLSFSLYLPVLPNVIIFSIISYSFSITRCFIFTQRVHHQSSARIKIHASSFIFAIAWCNVSIAIIWKIVKIKAHMVKKSRKKSGYFH